MIRSMLFLPGNSPKMLEKGPFLGADAIIFDLEDAVAPNQKDAARILLKHSLNEIRLGKTKKIVRINAVDEYGFWKKDLEAIVPLQPFAVMLPKVEKEDDIRMVSLYISSLEETYNLQPQCVKMILLLETCLGIEKAFDLARADQRVWAIQLGAEDLTADMHAKRTKQGAEIQYARAKVVMAARAAGVEAYDTPFTDMRDDESFEKDVLSAKDFGFSGKTAINPRHIKSINKIFLPTQEEIENAHAVLKAIIDGKAAGKGAVSLDGKMIDRPIMLRAQNVLAMEELFLEEAKNE